MKRPVAYQPGASLLHQLHPLVKLVWMLYAVVVLFAMPRVGVVLAALLMIFLFLLLSRVTLRNVRGLWMLMTTALLLGVLQIVFVRAGPVWLSFGRFTIHREGVIAAVTVGGRFLSVIGISYLFVLSTDPNALAYALMQVGLPYRYGFALITALRLVPIFEQEGRIIYHAQLARGIRYDVRSPRRFLLLARQFFVPLLVSALGKVNTLAVSMEGRCFGKYPQRTFLRKVTFAPRDAVALGLLGIVLMVSVWVL